MLTVRRDARGVRWRVLACAAVLLTGAVGCRTAHYRAADMPATLRVQPVARSKTINLAQLGGSGTNTAQLAPGDLVAITVDSGLGDQPSEPLKARISREGTIAVPLVGQVDVGGLEPVEAEQRIAAAAVERGIYRQPYVTLQVAERATNRVTVLGAVANPGVVELPRGSSDLLSALAAAGGLSELASTEVEILRHDRGSFFAGAPDPASGDAANGVRLAAYESPAATAHPSQRFAPPPLTGYETTASADPQQPLAGNQPTMRIDLAQAGPAVRTNYQLSDRDAVMVLPEERQVFHVTGLVQKPDQFELRRDEEIRVLDAIAMAGGIKSPLADKVFVIRHLPDMPKPAVIQVSIARAKANGDENLLLAPGDLVTVEQTPTTMIVDTASNFFRVAVGLSGNLATF